MLPIKRYEYARSYTSTTLSILTAIFAGGPGLAGTRMSPFWILLGAKGDGGGASSWNYRVCQKFMANFDAL